MRSLPLPLCLLAGCALPARDNPGDPANRPTAVLRVHVLGGASNRGFRDDTFVLDAGDSRNSADRTSGLRFWFDLDEDESDFEVGGEQGLTDPVLETPLEILDPEAGSGPSMRRVRVRVAEGESVSIATATAIVTNRAPILEIGEDLFVPPATGGPVRLDACGGRREPYACATRDPDGDPLTITWTQLTGSPLLGGATTATGSQVVFDAPMDEQTLLFGVRAYDGLAATSRFLRVHVTTQVWLTTYFPMRTYRLYADLRIAHALDDPDGYFDTAEGIDVDAGSGDVWLGASTRSDGNGNVVATRVRRYRPAASAFESIEEWDLGSLDCADEEEAAGPDNLCIGSVVSVAALGENGCAVVRPFDSVTYTDGASFVFLEEGGLATPFLSPDEGYPFQVLPAGDDGCWALSTRALYRLDAGGLVAVGDPIEAGHFLTSATLSSGGSLVLAVVAAGSQGDLGNTTLYRLAPGDEVPQLLATIPDVQFDALTNGPEGMLWAHDVYSGRTAALVSADADGDLTCAGTELPGVLGPIVGCLTGAPATALAQYDDLAPAVTSPFQPRFVGDPLERALWIVDRNQGALLRLEWLAGEFDQVRTLGANHLGVGTGPYFWRAVALHPIDRRALAAVRGQDAHALAWIPPHLTRIREIATSASVPKISADPTRGDLWLADGGLVNPDSLRKLDASGRALDAVGDEYPAMDVSVLPDGSLWSGGGGGGPDGWLMKIGPDGSVVRTVDLGTTVVGVDADADHVCILANDAVNPERRAAWRLDGNATEAVPLAGLTGEPLTFVADPPLPRAGPGGTCWFLGESSDCLDGVDSPDASIARVPGGSLQADLCADEDPDDDESQGLINTPGDLSVDRATGVAYATVQLDGDTIGILRVSGMTLSSSHVLPDLFGAFKLVEASRVCADSADPTCLELWITQGDRLDRYDSAGTLLDRYIVPEIGSGTYDLEVRP